MGESKTCPQCGLVNPPEAPLCDCGYSFVERRPTRPFHQRAELNEFDIVVCFLFPVFGIPIGLFRLVRGQPVGGKMIAFSAAVLAILFIFVFLPIYLITESFDR